ARSAGHDADVLLRSELLHRIRAFVAEAERRDRHIDVRAHAKSEQDALLHPRVDLPAGGARGIGLGGANQPAIEGFEKPAEGRAIAGAVFGRLVIKKLFDLSLHDVPEGRRFRAPSRSSPGWRR